MGPKKSPKSIPHGLGLSTLTTLKRNMNSFNRTLAAAILISSAWLYTSCGDKHAALSRDQYQIVGTVTNAKADGKVKLLRIAGTSLVVFDSTTTDKDGKFTLRGKLPEATPAYFLIDAYETQQALVVLDSASDVTAVLDGKDPQGKAELKGSKLIDSHNEVLAIREWFDNAQSAVNETFANNKEKMGIKSFSDSLADVAQKTDKELANKVKAQITKMGPTVVSLFAAGMLNPERDFSFMDSLARSFKVAKLGDMQGVASFVENLERISKVREGAMAPALELPKADGTLMSLASLKGQVVLVDFWASWCGPCRRANPDVVKLYNANKAKGFTVFGVSLDEDRDKWLEAIKKDGLTWNHVSDLKRWQSPVAVTWQVASIPSTFLVDRTGKIVGRNLHGPELEAKVQELLKQ